MQSVDKSSRIRASSQITSSTTKYIWIKRDSQGRLVGKQSKRPKKLR